MRESFELEKIFRIAKSNHRITESLSKGNIYTVVLPLHSPCRPHEGQYLCEIHLISRLLQLHLILAVAWLVHTGYCEQLLWGFEVLGYLQPIQWVNTVSSSITIGVCWKSRHQINISQTSVCAWRCRCVLGYLHSLCRMSSGCCSGKLVSTKYSESLNSSTWNSPMCSFAHRVLRNEKGFWINLHVFSQDTAFLPVMWYWDEDFHLYNSRVLFCLSKGHQSWYEGTMGWRNDCFSCHFFLQGLVTFTVKTQTSSLAWNCLASALRHSLKWSP